MTKNNNPQNLQSRNPKLEALEYIKSNLKDAGVKDLPGLAVYVLEPSPPAQNEPPLFADIPTEITGDKESAITPTSEGRYSWNDFEELADFSAERWLGHWKNLPELPENWIEKREDIHRLAFGVISEVRRLHNEKIGLRWGLGGFGTPFFGNDQQASFRYGVLIKEEAGEIKTAPAATLKEAGDFFGIEPVESQREGDSPELGDINRQLLADEESCDFLDNWFGMGTSVMEELRLMGKDPVPVQIWPGHFDVAIEITCGESRSTFGASPGDANHSEPYFYIGPHIEIDKSNPFWNAESFGGALLTLSDIKSSKNHRESILNFCRQGIQILEDI